MRALITLGAVASTLLFADANAAAQPWCTYSAVRATEFDCGYSTEKACEKAAKESQRTCTRDPFSG
jgi:uncharacterized membrane protein